MARLRIPSRESDIPVPPRRAKPPEEDESDEEEAANTEEEETSAREEEGAEGKHESKREDVEQRITELVEEITAEIEAWTTVSECEQELDGHIVELTEKLEQVEPARELKDVLPAPLLDRVMAYLTYRQTPAASQSRLRASRAVQRMCKKYGITRETLQEEFGERAITSKHFMTALLRFSESHDASYQDILDFSRPHADLRISNARGPKRRACAKKWSEKDLKDGLASFEAMKRGELNTNNITVTDASHPDLDSNNRSNHGKKRRVLHGTSQSPLHRLSMRHSSSGGSERSVEQSRRRDNDRPGRNSFLDYGIFDHAMDHLSSPTPSKHIPVPSLSSARAPQRSLGSEEKDDSFHFRRINSSRVARLEMEAPRKSVKFRGKHDAAEDSGMDLVFNFANRSASDDDSCDRIDFRPDSLSSNGTSPNNEYLQTSASADASKAHSKAEDDASAKKNSGLDGVGTRMPRTATAFPPRPPRPESSELKNSQEARTYSRDTTSPFLVHRVKDNRTPEREAAQGLLQLSVPKQPPLPPGMKSPVDLTGDVTPRISPRPDNQIDVVRSDRLREGEWLNTTVVVELLTIFTAAEPAWTLIDPADLDMSRLTEGTRRRMSSRSMLLFPIFSSHHWSCAVIRDVNIPIMYHYNSLRSTEPGQFDKARDHVHATFKALGHKERLAFYNVSSVAQQTNSDDCGIFTLVHAMYLVLHSQPPEQTNASLWRMIFAVMLRPSGEHPTDTRVTTSTQETLQEAKTLLVAFLTKMRFRSSILHQDLETISSHVRDQRTAIANASALVFDQQAESYQETLSLALEDLTRKYKDLGKLRADLERNTRKLEAGLHFTNTLLEGEKKREGQEKRRRLEQLNKESREQENEKRKRDKEYEAQWRKREDARFALETELQTLVEN